MMHFFANPVQWIYHEFGIASVHSTGRNAYLIILARSCRMFANGTNSLILAIFFSALGYSDHQIGIFLTLTLLGDVFLGTYLTLIADRVGRRKVLLGGSFLMISSGAIFAVFENFWILLVAAVLGVISVTGGDFGPFRSIEESVLSQLTTPLTRSDVLAWYVTTSTLGSSLGSEVSGRLIHFLQLRDGWRPVDTYHFLFWVYTAMGLVNALLVLALSDDCELPSAREDYVQLAQQEDEVLDSVDEQNPSLDRRVTSEIPRSWIMKLTSWLTSWTTRISAPTRSIMYGLWFLLALDSLADGMVPFSLTNYYMDDKFKPPKSTLGDVTSASYLLSSAGSVFAGPLARKIGFINTMVFTHIPSSTAVLLFPFPTVFWLTAGLLLVRMGLNNMDQAPRAAFIAAVVRPEERTAVMGITSMLRTLAAMAGPSFTGLMAANKQFWIAFVVAGFCRLLYDLGLYVMFINTTLYKHEGGSLDSGGASTTRSGEQAIDVSGAEVEMQSLPDPPISPSLDSVGDSERGLKDAFASGGLRPVLADERVRSRSPHRTTN